MFSRKLAASLRGFYEHREKDGTAGELNPRIDEGWLARELQRFGIAPHNVRIGDVQAKGYELEDFRNAFAAHLQDGFSE